MINTALLFAIGITLSITAYAAPSAKEVFSKASPSIVVIAVFDENKRQIGSGSGVVIERGKVVTNWHVIERASTVTVKRKDVNYTAQVLSDRRDRDLALLSVQGLESPPVGVSSIRTVEVGQPVYAVGAPAGLELTLTNGLVSALREVDDGKLIQTSAPISPGSSGGGLFNEQGQLIGITTLKGSGKAMEGLGFAVPADWVVQLVNPEKKIKTNSLLSEWGWFFGLAVLIFVLFFGRRSVSFLMDHLFERKQPSTVDTHQQAQQHSHEAQGPSNDPLPASLLQYAKIARDEFSHGQLEPSIWKKAEAFSNGDPALAQQLYIRFRAASLEDIDTATEATQLHSSNPPIAASNSNSDIASNRERKRARAAAILVSAIVVALLLSTPLIVGIAFQSEVESLFASSTVTTKFVKSNVEAYNRSWLKAEFVTSHRIDGAQKSVFVRHNVSHIPSFNQGLALVVKSEIDSSRNGTSDSDLAPLTRDHLPKATTTIHWGGKFASELSIKDLDPVRTGKSGTDIVSWRGIRFFLESSGRDSQTSLSLKAGGVSFENSEAKTKAGFSDLEISLDNSEVIFGDLTAGAKWRLGIGALLSSDPKLGTTKWGKTTISFSQTMAEDVFNGELSGSIADFSVKPPTPAIEYSGSNLIWKLNANRLSASALKNWNRYFLSENDPQFLPASAAIPQLLKHSPSLDISEAKISVNVNQASGDVALTAKFSIDAKGLNPETSTYDEYMQRALLSSTISASKALLIAALEASEKSDRSAHIAALEKKGEVYTQSEKISYLEQARNSAEAEVRKAVEQGFVIDRSDRVEAEINYADNKWTINGRSPDELDPKANEKNERESAITKTRQVSDSLRLESYPNQVKRVMQWRDAGLVGISRFEPPLDFQEVSLAKATLQRTGISLQPTTVIDALRDREVWWVGQGVFHFFLPNVTGHTVKGAIYELDFGGDCRARRVGPFVYRLFEFDPPIPPAGTQIVSVPPTSLMNSAPKGKMICGTLVGVW